MFLLEPDFIVVVLFWKAANQCGEVRDSPTRVAVVRRFRKPNARLLVKQKSETKGVSLFL